MSELWLDDYQTPHWFAIYTKPRSEKKLALILEKKGYQSYIPLIPGKNPRGRIITSIPLVPSYVFMNSRMDSEIWYEIVNNNLVIKFVGRKNMPEPIPNHEIDSIKLLIQRTQEPQKIQLEALRLEGVLVRILEGPFQGIIGRVVTVKPNRKKLIISVENISASISVEVDASNIERMEAYHE
ncbi:MAG: hypothetical protein KBA26_08045 [Candidatus Delongbacteria bacterium]|nr:hypothetical protein [Candidatus Delongbacteria bacterium]